MKKSFVIAILVLSLGIISCVSDNASPNSGNPAGQTDTDTTQNPDPDVVSNPDPDVVPNPDLTPDVDVVTPPDETPDPDIVIPAEKYPTGTTDTEKSFLQTLHPTAAYFEVGTPNGKRTFTANDNQGKVIGYAVISKNRGYKPYGVTQITGLTADGISIETITMDQKEDDPYWIKLTAAFFNQFKNLDIVNISLEPKYDPNCYPCNEMYKLFGSYNVDSVSGATYSSNAVTMGVLDAFYTFGQIPKK